MSNTQAQGQTQPVAPTLELRYQLALREAVARAQAQGFELVSRDPLTLRRGRATLSLQAGVLVKGLETPAESKQNPTRGFDISHT